MPNSTQTQNKLREPRSYGRVTKSEGPMIPVISDGTYLAQVADIQEGTSNFNGEESEQFIIKIEILDDDYRKDNGDPLDLRAYITIPPTLINDGVLNQNSNLYKFLMALGYDVTGDEIEVEPAQWQGEQLLVEITNKETTQQDGKKVTRPRITGYTRPPKAMKAAAPVKAGSAAAGGWNKSAPARPASAPPPRQSAAAARPATPAEPAADDSEDF